MSGSGRRSAPAGGRSPFAEWWYRTRDHSPSGSAGWSRWRSQAPTPSCHTEVRSGSGAPRRRNWLPPAGSPESWGPTGRRSRAAWWRSAGPMGSTWHRTASSSCTRAAGRSSRLSCRSADHAGSTGSGGRRAHRRSSVGCGPRRGGRAAERNCHGRRPGRRDAGGRPHCDTMAQGSSGRRCSRYAFGGRERPASRGRCGGPARTRVERAHRDSDRGVLRRRAVAVQARSSGGRRTGLSPERPGLGCRSSEAERDSRLRHRAAAVPGATPQSRSSRLRPGDAHTRRLSGVDSYA
jgi:hypothetical protein